MQTVLWILLALVVLVILALAWGPTKYISGESPQPPKARFHLWNPNLTSLEMWGSGMRLPFYTIAGFGFSWHALDTLFVWIVRKGTERAPSEY